MILAATIATTFAVILQWPPGRLLVRWRLGSQAHDGPLPWRRAVPLLIGVAAACVIAVADSTSVVIAGSTLGGVAWFAWRLRESARRTAVRRERSAEIGEAVATLAAELGAGIVPDRALQQLAVDLPLFDAAASASRIGGDVGDSLRTTSQLPGAEALADLAAAWEVSERAGAPMARILDRLGEGLRDEREVQREILAGIGPARATARLMAVLPVFGLGLGASMGASPLDTLVGTVPGSLCLACGSALACAGLWWVDKIAARAEGL